MAWQSVLVSRGGVNIQSLAIPRRSKAQQVVSERRPRMIYPNHEIRVMDFFISRAGADAAEAIWIAQELRAAGYTTWLQDEDSRIDEFITESMSIGAECRYTISVLSPEYFCSDYTKVEWQSAFYSRRLVLILLRKCSRPEIGRAHV